MLDARRLQCRTWRWGAIRALADFNGTDRKRSGCQSPSLRRSCSPFLWGCAGLHLDQGPDQVIQRTEGEDKYELRQKAGPVCRPRPALRPARRAIVRSRVYASHRIAPRAPVCAADDPSDCDAPADDRRAARWLDEWRYVWSCDTPDKCGVRTAGESAPVGGLGVQIWARRASNVRKLSSPSVELSAATRGTGNPTSTGSCALFPSTISTIRFVTTSATSSAVSNATRVTARAGPRSPPSATRSAAGWPSSLPIPIRASGGSTPSIPRW